MILMVPTSPEVPKLLRPKLGPALMVILAIAIFYLGVQETVHRDSDFVDNLQTAIEKSPSINPDMYLKLRPLLKVAPAKGDWDLRRFILANFIHGNTVHLILNLIGVFAGFRICSPFLPFLAILSIFILGGTIGLATSTFLTNQYSPYIPHVGASAGIFALMGSYYVYNFHFRTSYFFWIPHKKGFISLRTSWFFLFDVFLMELVLSTAQFFPEKLDSVDHIAHVSGFLSGAAIALTLRLIQQWPSFLQTRGEFLYWVKILQPSLLVAKANQDPIATVRLLAAWLELLKINRYNDSLKIRTLSLVSHHPEKIPDMLVAEVFRHASPTFVRLYPYPVGVMIRVLLSNNRRVPDRWLCRLPYDSFIQIAKQLSAPAKEQHFLFQLVERYRTLQGGGGNKKGAHIEKLFSELKSVLSVKEGSVTTEVETDDSETADKSQNQKNTDSKQQTATKAS